VTEVREFSFPRGKTILFKDAHQFWGSYPVATGLKRPGLEADHSLPYTVEVKE